MQNVSENWKNVHNQTLLNESFVEISLDIADPDALAKASPSDNGAIYISKSSELTNGIDISPSPYCTLEQNIWVLNGSRKAIPETLKGSNGFVSDVLSDETCMFSNKIPTLTVDFGEEFESIIPGITITWSNTYGEYAVDFIVRAYKGDTLLVEREVIDNHNVKSLIMADIVGYDKIVIFVKKWCLPHHRVRVEEIFIGINKVYSKTDLFSYTHKQSVDPLSISLPKNEIQFSVNNVDGEYNPYNEEGMTKYLMARQEIKTRYGLKLNDNTVEWIKGGTFYLSEWSAKQNGLTADFTARDLLEFMYMTYVGTSYVGLTSSLYDYALVVLHSANLPKNSDGTVKWIIDESLKEKYSNAPLQEDTLANYLQLIANAGECVLYPDRDGNLHIEPLKTTDFDYKINSFNSYSKPEITLSKPIKQVDVKVYSYTEGDNGIESTTTIESVTVGTIGEIITIDNPLITDADRAKAVGTWMATHLGHRMALDSSWRADVSLDALDIISNENDYKTNRVRMTDVEFRYNGAFRGTGKGKVI